ncbi:hypothetical protein CCACVL1_11566, partial [Corchorus capsularis]
ASPSPSKQNKVSNWLHMFASSIFASIAKVSINS